LLRAQHEGNDQQQEKTTQFAKALLARTMLAKTIHGSLFCGTNSWAPELRAGFAFWLELDEIE
jgi:hypothetical protein